MFNRQMYSRVNANFLSSITFVRRKHAYKVPSWTLSQLEEHLMKSAVHENGLLIVNKPAGICFERGLISADSLNPARPVCLKSALPALKEHFNVNELHNVIIPERNISGVTVFSDSEKIAQTAQKWIKVMRDTQIESYIYHAVVIGTPRKDSGHFKGCISLVTKNGNKRILLSEEIVKNRVKRGEEKKISFSYKTLVKSDCASLIEVHTNRTKWNSTRAFLATELLTPVLGDSLYGMYVQTILGIPVLIDVFSKPKLPQQKLPENVMNQLEINYRKDIEVPLHLHLYSVKMMLKRKDSLEYCMPYSDVFTWTLEQLGLVKDQSLIKTASAA